MSSLTLISAILPWVRADSAPATIIGTNAAGVEQVLLVDRYPALYTGDFGDCMGGQSLINITSFDAAYYADNLTVLFDLAGTTNLRSEAVILYISVEAYGEDRFNLTFDPCGAGFTTLCPLNASTPVTGSATIPIGPQYVTGIPNIAFSIPDFEGSATLRIFSNATQTQIGCFQAVMRNANSFSHPAAVGSVLAVFTVVALLASFATAIYGVSLPQIRTHYAHSLSMLVVFEVFQYIFFSGALSLSWPSVLPAFWSNFAWSGGQIHTAPIINSINGFVGVSGNSSQVGGAGTVDLNTAGGLQQQIYGRSIERHWDILANRSELAASSIYKRVDKESASQFSLNPWAGSPVSPGLPLPGTFDGFVGELAQSNIPAADAFLNGLLWFLIFVSILIGAMILFKWSLEFFTHMKVLKPDRFIIFRSLWLGYVGLVVLRSMLIAFFMIMTLTLYQFSSGGKAGVLAVATIVFVIFFAGILGATLYATYSRVRLGKYTPESDSAIPQQKRSMKAISWFKMSWANTPRNGKNRTNPATSLSLFQLHPLDGESEHQSVHQDENHIKRFGWLSARYRRTRWWFAAVWVIYQFVRACFIGGARGHPTAQVFGLLVWEIIALVAIIIINPFEGTRNTALSVYMLGLSKVATTGLSVAFLPQFNVARIPTTVIGIVIIVIQGLLVIGLLILIVLGAISTYMSITRNRDHIKPRDLEIIRMKYFNTIDRKAIDLPPPPPPVPQTPKEPNFNVITVRRAPKIEDEDEDLVPDIIHPGAESQGPLANRISRASSIGSYKSVYGNVPFGARVHRASWSSRDFQVWQEERSGSPSNPASRRTSTRNTTNHSASNPPLVKPTASESSLRTSTPTIGQEKPANRSVAFAE